MEAHAQDEWPINEKLKINQHKSCQDRCNAVSKFCEETLFQIPLYMDTMENEFHQLFGAWPERYYIVDQGKIVRLGHPGPMGYNTANWPEEIESWLKANVK